MIAGSCHTVYSIVKCLHDAAVCTQTRATLLVCRWHKGLEGDNGLDADSARLAMPSSQASSGQQETSGMPTSSIHQKTAEAGEASAQDNLHPSGDGSFELSPEEEQQTALRKLRREIFGLVVQDVEVEEEEQEHDDLDEFSGDEDELSDTAPDAGRSDEISWKVRQMAHL